MENKARYTRAYLQRISTRLFSVRCPNKRVVDSEKEKIIGKNVFFNFFQKFIRIFLSRWRNQDIRLYPALAEK